MRRFSLTLIAAGLMLICTPGAAATPLTTINQIDWYADQGFKRNGASITDSQRTDPLSIFTANDNKWLSLGFEPASQIGGIVHGSTAPGYFLSGVLELREVTWNVKTAGYPEAVRVTFTGSLNGSSDLSIDLGQTPASCTPGLTCSTSLLNSASTQWLISGFDGYRFTSVEIADITRSLSSKASDDGWDLDYVSATTSAVPEPGSLALLGGGILLLAISRKRFRRHEV